MGLNRTPKDYFNYIIARCCTSVWFPPRLRARWKYELPHKFKTLVSVHANKHHSKLTRHSSLLILPDCSTGVRTMVGRLLRSILGYGIVTGWSNSSIPIRPSLRTQFFSRSRDVSRRILKVPYLISNTWRHNEFMHMELSRWKNGNNGKHDSRHAEFSWITYIYSRLPGFHEWNAP